MKYAYYPGCSIEKNAAAYGDSFKAVADVLSQEMCELNDWNCCGATEYLSIDPIPGYSLIARNLALVPPDTKELVAPCSACYLNLWKTDSYMGKSKQLNSDVNAALAEANLSYRPGSVHVRHALDVFVNDVGFEQITTHVKQPLKGLKLAPYYGCMIVRPGHGFDDTEQPMTLDHLLEALGATVVDYPLKASCCGGHMPQINEKTAFTLIHELIATAVNKGADAIVTLCPMCQLNLDAYQSQSNSLYGTGYSIPVLYFTQMMGLAFGLDPKKLGFGLELVSAMPVFEKLASPAEEEPKKKPMRDKKALPMPRMP